MDERKSRGNTTGKNIAALNHFGIYQFSIYKDTLEYRIQKKIDWKRMFPLLQKKIGLLMRRDVEEERSSAYLRKYGFFMY